MLRVLSVLCVLWGGFSTSLVLNVGVINVTIVKSVMNVVSVVCVMSVMHVKSVVKMSSVRDDLRVL